jgi:hypothetical protein
VIRLTCDGLDPLVLDDWDAGLVCQEFDLGWPTIRDVVEDRPGADGTFDTTIYHGARVVSVRVAVVAGSWSSRRALIDHLTGFLHPARRPTMEFVDPTSGGTRTMLLRPVDASAPMTNPTVTEVAAQWVAPSGVMTSAEVHQDSLLPSGEAGGWSPPLDPPLTFPAFTGSGAVQVNNIGNAPAHWTAKIFGPCSAPSITNRNTGQVVRFPELAILDGDYLEVDSQTRTVTLNSDPGSSRYRFLDFGASSWWTLAPGATFVEFTAESATPPSVADLLWRDTWI